LRSFQQHLSDFTSRGVKIVAISVDSEEINRAHARKMGFTFPLLSDTDAAVIRLYDVLHRGAGPKGADIARPAEFYVNRDGVVRWVDLTGNIAVRARPEQALAAIDAEK
jgi:peroxiredoxin Q/BCP